MGKRFQVLVLAVAALSARAISQEIVIEPTNGNTQPKVRVTRPAAVESTPAQPKATLKTAEQQTAPSKTAAKNPAIRRVSVKPKAAPVESKPVAIPAPESAKVETPAASAPAPKKVPERPDWAFNDTRDAQMLQTEIANALARDPKLSGSSVKVNVDGDSVTVQGQVAGTEERLQAVRLAQSYAWNRKVIDKIDVVHGASAQK